MAQSLSHDPFWWEEATPRTQPQTGIAPDCDVAIIGAGYTGLSAALTLAKAGKTVQVFEKDRPGEGASSRNGGITSGSLRIGLAAAIKQFGPERGVAIHREAIEARRFLRQRITEHDIDCDYALTGLFTGALNRADFDAQKRMADLTNAQLGAEYRIIEGAELASFTGSRRYVGGMLNPEVGTIHPGKLVQGLVGAALRQGAVVHAQTPVLAVQRAADGFSVKTSRGTCRTSQIIVATNGYSDASNRWLLRRLVPVTSRIVVTEELPSNLVATLIPDARGSGEIRKLFHYFRPTPDGKRILLGGREPPWTGSRDKAIAHLRAGLVHIFPELESYGLSHSWSGNVAFSRNLMPAMFEQDGMHYAVGYCGSGTVWAPWLGHKTALKILGDSDGQSAFDGPPPKPVPLYAGKPWFLPAVITGYGLSDWMNGRK